MTHEGRRGRASALPLWLLVLALAGCAVTPEQPRGPAPDATAQAHAAAGRYREAAEEWLRLAARSTGDAATQYRLDAAESLVLAGDPAEARRRLAEVQVRGIPAGLRIKSDIVTARLFLVENRADQALAALRGPYPAQTGRSDRFRAQIVRAEAQERLGRPFEAARERVSAEPFATEGAETSRNRLATWGLLSRVPTRALSEGRAAPPDPFAGWLELAALQRRHGRDVTAFAQAISAWRSRYPRHPADIDLVPELLDLARTRGGMPIHVALLLPQEGPFAPPARAVREGFVAAWYAQGGGSTVSFFDATAESLQTAIDQAIEAGADFIVGPLDKPAVNRLVGSASVPVPVLALNRADVTGAAPGPAVYQFALAPEEEASAAARRARADGLGRAGVLYPASEWGDRVAGAFRDAWQELGGVTVAEARYSNEPESIAGAVRTVLSAGGAGGTPGIDVVFLAGFPTQARQVRPQISHQYRGPLPVYATSHVYTGVPSASQDLDLEGVVFPDMPWVLSPGSVEPELQQTLGREWRELREGYNRLFAFGVDAYRLLPYLGPAGGKAGATIAGVSGELRLEGDGRVAREGAWAQFRDGLPVPLAGSRTSP